MILNTPLAIWIGFLTFLILLVQVSLGIAMVVFKKKVFKIHRFIGFTILLLATIHMILGIMLWYFGKLF